MEITLEDGCLPEITSGTSLNSELNIIIIRRPKEFTELGETTYTFATLDRTKEGVEWPGDHFLDKLIPGLSKVNVLDLKKPEATTKTCNRHHVRKKYNPRPVLKDYCFTVHRPRHPQKKSHSNQTENPPLINDIEPWIHKPWENQSYLPRLSVVPPASTPPPIPAVPFNNFHAQNSPSTSLLPPRTSSNNFNFPYSRHTKPSGTSNTRFLFLSRPPPPTNRLPSGPPPSFPPPIRFLTHHPPPPIRGFCGPGPAPNVNFNGTALNTGVLGETPGVRQSVKYGLLGDSPFANSSFNRNLPMFPNNTSGQSNPMGYTTSMPPKEENIDDQNSSISNTEVCSVNVSSYDTGYGEATRPNSDQFNDGNEFSMQESHGSYEYPYEADNSFIDARETSYSRFHNSSSSNNLYENQYKGNYIHLDRKHPNESNKNIISLKSSRGSYRRNYEGLKVKSKSLSHFENTDSLCENRHEKNRVFHKPKTTPLVNNLSRSLSEESLIHLCDTTVVYNPRKFENDGYPAADTNSSAPISNINSVSGSNFNQNVHNKYTQRRGRRWIVNNWPNRVKYYQGRHRYQNWKTPRR